MLLLAQPTKTEEEQIEEIVDNIFWAWKAYKHERTKESVLKLVKLAQQLEVWGYSVRLEHTKRVLIATNTRRRNEPSREVGAH